MHSIPELIWKSNLHLPERKSNTKTTERHFSVLESRTDHKTATHSPTVCWYIIYMKIWGNSLGPNSSSSICPMYVMTFNPVKYLHHCETWYVMILLSTCSFCPPPQGDRALDGEDNSVICSRTLQQGGSLQKQTLKPGSCGWRMISLHIRPSRSPINPHKISYSGLQQRAADPINPSLMWNSKAAASLQP